MCLTLFIHRVYIVASVEDFIAGPTERFLDVCSREQLLKLKHYGVEVGDKRLKDRVRALLKVDLLERKFLTGDELSVPPPTTVVPPPGVASGLTFEQQKELLLLQLEHEKFKLQAVVEKELALQKVRHRTGEVRGGTMKAGTNPGGKDWIWFGGS